MNFIAEHFLSILVFAPLVFALLIPLIPEGANGKNLHIFGIGASVLCDPADGFASNPACASGQSCVARANGTMTLYRCE